MTRIGRRGNPILGGAETAVAAARAAVSSAARSASRRGLAQTFTPPPRFSLCSSPLAPSGSYRQAQSSPIAAPSASAPEVLRLREGRPSALFSRPTSHRNHLRPLRPCNARRPRPPRPLVPGYGTGCVPYPGTSTRRSHDHSHR